MKSTVFFASIKSFECLPDRVELSDKIRSFCKNFTIAYGNLEKNVSYENICIRMRTNVIALRIDNYTADLIEKIIKYKLADNKADALRLIMQNGIQSAKKSVERKERSEIIIKKWKEKGLPELPENLSEISIRDRE